jgi:DNA repair exonuclease SbcCD nuclease subunit
MAEFQFIHAADLHLGAPFAGLRQDNPRLAKMADDATYAAFEKIVGLAVARKVLFVLFSGDIYDADYPNLKAQLRFRDGISQLDKAGIQSCAIRGNHDHGGSVRAQLEFPSSYYEFAPGANEPYYIYHNETPVAAIYGYSYPRRAVTENILRHYATRPEDQKYFRIGMLHANVGGDAAHDNYAPCSIAQLKEIEIDYWALGHVHQAKVLSQTPAIVYPGTPQGLSPRENDEHGCYVVTAQEHRCKMEFVATDSMRRIDLQYDITGISSEEELLRSMEELLLRQRETIQHPLIARLDLTGRGTLHRSLQTAGRLQEIQDYLNQQTAGDPFLNCLQDATQPDIDLETRRLENNLLGDFLRLCRDAKNDEELQRKVLLELAEVCEHSVVKDALGLRGHAEQQAWLAEQLPRWLELAEIQGADLLLEDAS